MICLYFIVILTWLFLFFNWTSLLFLIIYFYLSIGLFISHILINSIFWWLLIVFVRYRLFLLLFLRKLSTIISLLHIHFLYLLLIVLTRINLFQRNISFFFLLDISAKKSSHIFRLQYIKILDFTIYYSFLKFLRIENELIFCQIFIIWSISAINLNEIESFRLFIPNKNNVV